MDRIFALLNTAIHLAQAESPRQVAAVYIIKGAMTEPDEGSFRQIWKSLAKSTPLENAQLKITNITAQAQCMICREFYEPEERKILCPDCGSVGAKIISGEEFRLDRVETI